MTFLTNSTIAQSIGKCSYGAYIFHIAVITIIAPLLGDIGPVYKRTHYPVCNCLCSDRRSSAHFLPCFREADHCLRKFQSRERTRIPELSLKSGDVKGQAAAVVPSRSGGVVSRVFNLELSGVEASDWRPRHDEHYHEA